MNKYQRLIVVVAVIDALLMILFPPFNDTPLSRGALPSFEGFYPLISQFGHKPINDQLLTMQLMLLAANGLAAFLCMQTRSNTEGESTEFNFSVGIACFTVINVAVMLLFPPFEPYSSMLRGLGSSFDSFYFVWGNRSGRPIFVPLLYLELVFVAVNALALWLLFNIVKRADQADREHLLRLADGLDEKELAQLSAEVRSRIEAHRAGMPTRQLGRGEDRRHGADPDYPGPERRRAARRTHT